MTTEQGKDHNEYTPLIPVDDLFSGKLLKKITTQGKGFELERILSEEGLRELTQKRTRYILQYMMRPDLNYESGNFYSIKVLLHHEYEGKTLIEPRTLWNALEGERDLRRMRIVLDEIGMVLGVPDINGKANTLARDIVNLKTDQDNALFQTNNPSFDVMLKFDQNGFDCRFVKK